MKITYADKLALINDDTIPNENKVSDADMNEIKKVINANEDNLVQAQQDIEELQQENTDLKNLLPTVSEEGENVTLDNTGEARFKNIVVGGNSWQEISEPSPEEQSEIKNVSDNINFIVCNDNFFNGDLLNGYWTPETKKLTDTSSTIFKSFKAFLKAGTYTLSCNTNINIIRAFTDYDNSAVVIFSKDYTNLNSYIMAIAEDTTLYMSVGRNDNTNWLDTDLLKLQKGTVATDYIEHQSQSFTFPLVEGQRLYKDSELLDDGIHHARLKVIFDGSIDEVWDIRSDTHEMRIGLSKYNAVYNSEILCDKLLQATAYDGTGNKIRWVLNSQIICIHSDDLDTANMTLEEWKEYLSENNLTIEIGVTEYIEPYTEEQQAVYNEIQKAKSYLGQTYVFSTNEISPIFKVEAFGNINLIINNITAAMVE